MKFSDSVGPRLWKHKDYAIGETNWGSKIPGLISIIDSQSIALKVSLLKRSIQYPKSHHPSTVTTYPHYRKLKKQDRTNSKRTHNVIAWHFKHRYRPFTQSITSNYSILADDWLKVRTQYPVRL